MSLKADLKNQSNPTKATFYQRFFKTGPGEYAEGDIFIGVTVPNIRKVARRYNAIPLEQIEKLLQSPVHEERLCALIILVEQSKLADATHLKKCYDLYLRNTAWVNNWDLVDVSAEHVVGRYLHKRNKKPLLKLAHSKDLWERRIAIMATFHFIKQGQSNTTLEIAEILVNDPHDLIHKAVGWMLREVGKRCSMEAEKIFLNKFATTMPRTMLRYAIERFPPEERRYYMNMKANLRRL